MILISSVPTYEYECPRCPRVFEVRQRISEPALTTCDRCGGPVHRLLAPAAFILKGGGWYVTDYPSDARKKAMSSESGSKSSAGSDAKSSTSSESSSSSGSSSPSAGSAGSKDSPKKTGGS
ncbi:MAG TPA: FmdB family zinc ribbon protein [Methylomirabilota bacterium]|nr:FmdB family zinc ribbon protein [Methylomirabilota bacterium]